MTLWLHEFFAPETILRNVAFFLLVLGMGMTSMVLLRVLVALAAAVGLVLALFVAFDPTMIFWWLLTLVVTLTRLLASRSWKMGRPLSSEEKLFQKIVTPSLSAGQVRKLLTAGRWVDVDSGAVLIEQNEISGYLVFVTRGTFDIKVDGQKIAQCGPGDLIGEVGVATGEPATATVMSATPARFLEFEPARLRRMLEEHVDLLDAMDLAILRSLREKLASANRRAAHPESVRNG